MQNLVLVNKDSHQKEIITQWPICLALKFNNAHKNDLRSTITKGVSFSG